MRRVQKVSSSSVLPPCCLLISAYRLKLRCDRNIPCSSCVKRGCGAICPDGISSCFSIGLSTPSYSRHRFSHYGSRKPVCPHLFLPSPHFSPPPIRFVLASTQELHEKITELCTRVRELEDALRASHNQTASDTHPLLSEDLLRVKAPLQRDVSLRSHTITNQPEDDDTNPDDVDSFGTLSISHTGQTKYYGQPANSWVSLFFFELL